MAKNKEKKYDEEGVLILNSRFALFGTTEEEKQIENFGDFIFNISPFVYRFFVNIPDFFREIKWKLQRIFRKGHYSDIDLWGLDTRLTDIILPKLIAFRNQGLHGFPSVFSDWDEEYGGMGMTKEEYDKEIEEGTMVGGGFDEWLRVLDEMIYAFEYSKYNDDLDRKGNPSKAQKLFFEKYGYKDPFRETEDNLSWSYLYKSKNGSSMSCNEDDYRKIKEGKNDKYKDWELVGKFPSYFDPEASRKQAVRAQKGFELFGKYFQNLWD